jgi:hypothetical protein
LATRQHLNWGLDWRCIKGAFFFTFLRSIGTFRNMTAAAKHFPRFKVILHHRLQFPLPAIPMQRLICG